MTPGTSSTILVHEWVTGGGLAGSPLPASWAAEGRAMRRAIATDIANISDDSVRVIVTLDARLTPDPGRWQVEPITEHEPFDRVRELARRADYTVLVAPETSGVLASLTRELRQAGARVMGSTLEAIELTGDKARLARHLDRLAIDTPNTRTIIPSAGLPEDAEYPAVLKPIDGAGSVETFYLPDALSLPADAGGMPSALLQPFVPGRAMSASFLVAKDGRPWLIGVGTQHIAIRGGRFEYLGGTLPASCRSAATQLEPAVESIAGLRGFVGVDFIWDEERRHATLIEINPRPTTSYVGLSRLLPPGRLASAWLDAFEGARADDGLLGGLADLVHGSAPISFNARGETSRVDDGVEQ